MVDLQDFVQQTILDILKGVAAARKDPEVGGLVAPAVTEHAKIDPGFGVAWHDKAMWSVMRFDIAITAQATAEKGGSAKIGVKVLSFEASVGGEGKQGGKSETVSRVQFPVHFRLDQGSLGS